MYIDTESEYCIMDTVEKRFSICWFGQGINGWEDFIVGQTVVEKEEEKEIVFEQADKELFEFTPLHSTERG